MGFGSELALAILLVPDTVLWMSEDGATVAKVTVELPPLLVTDTGLGLRLQVGAVAPVMTGDMVHERVTLPVYPFTGVAVTVAVDELPGLTEVGLAAPAESE